jgi:hypothetical protein
VQFPDYVGAFVVKAPAQYRMRSGFETSDLPGAKQQGESVVQRLRSAFMGGRCCCLGGAALHVAVFALALDCSVACWCFCLAARGVCVLATTRIYQARSSGGSRWCSDCAAHLWEVGAAAWVVLRCMLKSLRRRLIVVLLVGASVLGGGVLATTRIYRGRSSGGRQWCSDCAAPSWEVGDPSLVRCWIVLLVLTVDWR